MLGKLPRQLCGRRFREKSSEPNTVSWMWQWQAGKGKSKSHVGGVNPLDTGKSEATGMTGGLLF